MHVTSKKLMVTIYWAFLGKNMLIGEHLKLVVQEFQKTAQSSAIP